MATTCSGGGKGGVTAEVKTIATQIQTQVNTEATTGGGNVDEHGESKLKASLKAARFGNSLNGSGLEDDEICKLNIQTHTNDKRTYDDKADGSDTSKHSGPCTGKGKDIFNIGVRWTTDDDKVDTNHKGVLLPPRRKNMCTSNLENLQTSNQGLKLFSFATHSLLADVLLAAKEEAQKIIEQYKEKNKENGKDILQDPKHKECICNAIKSSFADLGDIIRGRDLWSNESGNKNIQENLKTIFEQIKKTVNQGVNTYNKDTPDHTMLRNHWWEANRKSVWKAMTTCGDAAKIECNKRGAGSTGSTGSTGYRSQRGHSRGRNQNSRRVTSSGGLSTSSSVSVPHDDYIPQRLRWLTEWAENYCRAQAKEYNELVSKCGTCKTKNGNCDSECQGCKEKCKEYKQFITNWKADWDEQKKQYETYYQEAQKNNGKDGKDENLKYLYQFLNELHTRNQATGSVYGSAGGYIKQELSTKNGCEGQNEFCSESDKKYAFQPTPDGYQQACQCTKPVPPVPLPTCTDNKILDAARNIHHYAEAEWKSRDSGGSKGTESKLKGKAHLGQYKHNKNGDVNELQNDICKITIDHSNDKREKGTGTNQYHGPCSGKGTGRFVIGEKWKPGGDTNMRSGYGDVLLPPRRQHMCTSNLENLDTGFTGLTGTDVNHSFLGDVLLAAKTEAEKIKELYDQNGAASDDATKCRAITASFADIGDIIRGTDIWEDRDQKKLQGYLKEIFKKIKDQVDSGNKNYASDNDQTQPPYKTLREDWWTANRDKVWEAMKCSGMTTCSDGDTPVDDYVPQTLRWLDEWSHQFCVERKKLADEVVTKCGKCKDASDEYHKNNSVDKNTSGSSTGTSGADGKNCDTTNGGGNNSGDADCAQCKTACDACKQACTAYTQFVEGNSGNNKWRDQWKNMNDRYTQLMTTAKDKIEEYHKDQQKQAKSQTPSVIIPPYMTPCGNNSGSNSVNSGDNLCVKNDIDSFFQNLHESGTTTLSSYINNMSHDTNCGGDKHVVATNMWLYI
uniref:EMP1-like protein n=4 Tax=Plasmodium gaboni TaxID=647221 RepID=A0A0P0H275_9APIC|nr:EMP1-like protein [Plasmodium gaboni]